MYTILTNWYSYKFRRGYKIRYALLIIYQNYGIVAPCGQRVRLLFFQSEFESHLSLKFMSVKYLLKMKVNQKKSRPTDPSVIAIVYYNIGSCSQCYKTSLDKI